MKTIRPQIIEQQKDHFIVAAYGFGLFEGSWVLRGFENVLTDVVANIDFYEELLDRLVDHQMEILDRLLKLPVDGIWFFDDWGVPTRRINWPRTLAQVI